MKEILIALAILALIIAFAWVESMREVGREIDNDK